MSDKHLVGWPAAGRPSQVRCRRLPGGAEMSWTWVWIGGALALGFFLGATLMSLLVMSRDSESEDGQAPPGPESKKVLNWARPVVTAGSGSFLLGR